MINERMGCVSIEVFAEWYAHGVRRNAYKALPALEILFEFAGLLDNGHFKRPVATAASQFVRVCRDSRFHGVDKILVKIQIQHILTCWI